MPSQRTRRQPQPESDDETNVNGDGDVDMDQDLRPGGETDMLRKANDLVRLALFTEQKRTPLRRDDISKKVLGSNTRSFNTVFNQAQHILRNTFGMELVELRSRADDKPAPSATQDPVADAVAATGIKKKATTGSKTYILRSTLHPTIIEHASLTNEQILEEEFASLPDDDDNDGEGFGARPYGSIIAWTHADYLAPVGLLYVVLALILVSGRVMSDIDLRANLKRLRLPTTASIAYPPQSTHRTLPLDAYLTTLVRQGYIDRQRAGDSGGGGAGKRGRVGTQVGGEEGVAWMWMWGSRAIREVGEVGIGKFVAEFMVERMGEGGDEEESGDEGEEAEGQRGGRRGKSKSNGKKKGKGKAGEAETEMGRKMGAIMKGIERAAGGKLGDK